MPSQWSICSYPHERLLPSHFRKSVRSFPFIHPIPAIRQHALAEDISKLSEQTPFVALIQIYTVITRSNLHRVSITPILLVHAIFRTCIRPKHSMLYMGGESSEVPGGLAGLHDRQDLHKIGTGMALECIETRLRRLEAAHTLEDPEDSQSTLTCSATAEIAKQVDAQGTEYNILEETVYNLEVAGRDKESRLARLESLVQDLANGTNPTQEATQQISKANRKVLASDPTAIIPTHSNDTATHNSALDEITARLHRLESSQTRSLHSHSTHELAQELLYRLGNGDRLERIVHLQLQTTLSGIAINPPHHLPLTPAATGASRGVTTASRTSEKTYQKRRPGRPRKHWLNESSGEDPTPKRPRGRPSKRGRSSRKASIESGSAGSDLSGSSIQDRNTSISQRINTTQGDERRSRSTDKMSGTERRNSPEEVAEVSETQDDERSFGELDSDEPLRDYRQRVQRRIICSTDSDDDVEVSNAGNALAAFKKAQSRCNGSPGSDHAINMEVEDMHEPSSENATVPEELRSTRRGAVSADAYIETIEEEQIDIPPERRSARTPKRTKPFGDVMSWKEANLQL